MDIEIRHIDIDNAAEMQAVYAIEDMCFPKEEQDSKETIYCRAKTCPDFFWVAADKGTGEIIGFFNGMPTEQEEYTEEVFTDFSLCKPEGLGNGDKHRHCPRLQEAGRCQKAAGVCFE